MDIALAIHKIDPKARYLLNHSQADDSQAILKWRGPGLQPTQEQIKDAWELVELERERDALIEQDRQEALARVKTNTEMSDLVKVLRL